MKPCPCVERIFGQRLVAFGGMLDGDRVPTIDSKKVIICSLNSLCFGRHAKDARGLVALWRVACRIIYSVLGRVQRASSYV